MKVQVLYEKVGDKFLPQQNKWKEGMEISWDKNENNFFTECDRRCEVLYQEIYKMMWNGMTKWEKLMRKVPVSVKWRNRKLHYIKCTRRKIQF